ncbi:hypothetical protein GH733_015976 [Mirounga leonina]|nr:hypothetical protein GH733_015976 [Mirounga leonina]
MSVQQCGGQQKAQEASNRCQVQRMKKPKAGGKKGTGQQGDWRHDFPLESIHYPLSTGPGRSSETASGSQHKHSDGMLGSSLPRPTPQASVNTQAHLREGGYEIKLQPCNPPASHELI